LAERRRHDVITMAFVYVLRSLKNKKRYIGSTDLAPEERLKKHNYGSNKFTKRNGPFVLIYKEKYADKTEARKRENFLKSGIGRKYLDGILKNK
jgi:putative endonuclease